MLAKLSSVCEELLLLKEDFWSSSRFLANTSVKHRDYKVRQRRTTKCDRFKNYKVRQNWITNYDRFWNTKCNKILKNWITKCNGIEKCDKFGLQISMGLHSATDYKVIQYRTQLSFCKSVLEKSESKVEFSLLSCLPIAVWQLIQFWISNWLKNNKKFI